MFSDRVLVFWASVRVKHSVKVRVHVRDRYRVRVFFMFYVLGFRIFI